MRIDIFGMWVESYALSRVSTDILSKTNGSTSVLVVTPNVDHFLRWQRESNFRTLYDKADFRLIDGMPILLLARLLCKGDSQRVTGIDLSIELVKLAAESGIPVAIIGGSQRAITLASENLLKTHPTLQVFFTSSPTSEQLVDSTYIAYVANALSQHKAKVVLLCLGSPKQEQFYFDLLQAHSVTGTYLAVGATIDFLANLKKRAPIIVQKIGLEWIFRLIQEPKRLFRRYFVSGIFILPYLIRALIIFTKNRMRKTA
jgi:N-acetylglucosaminyldiphosphoundecaprenol N-acetyl-beta-D-mannosaminyltransferase